VTGAIQFRIRFAVALKTAYIKFIPHLVTSCGLRHSRVLQLDGLTRSVNAHLHVGARLMVFLDPAHATAFAQSLDDPTDRDVARLWDGEDEAEEEHD
jgi:hypothetical protein